VGLLGKPAFLYISNLHSFTSQTCIPLHLKPAFLYISNLHSFTSQTCIPLHLKPAFLYISNLHSFTSQTCIPLHLKPAFLYISNQRFPSFFACGPVLALKNNHRSYILAHVNIECLDDRYPKLKIYISEMILDSYKYIPVAYATMHTMVLP